MLKLSQTHAEEKLTKTDVVPFDGAARRHQILRKAEYDTSRDYSDANIGPSADKLLESSFLCIGPKF